jgi:hypothetical protein
LQASNLAGAGRRRSSLGWRTKSFNLRQNQGYTQRVIFWCGNSETESPFPLPRHKPGKEGTGQEDSWWRRGSAKSGKLKNLRPGGRPGTRDRPGNGHFLSDGTIPAHGQPPYVDILVKIPFQQVLQVLSSAHDVALRAGSLRNRQLTGLIGADDHVPFVLCQPLIGCDTILGQWILLWAEF